MSWRNDEMPSVLSVNIDDFEDEALARIQSFHTECRSLESVIGLMITVEDEDILERLDDMDLEEGRAGQENSRRRSYERCETRQRAKSPEYDLLDIPDPIRRCAYQERELQEEFAATATSPDEPIHFCIAIENCEAQALARLQAFYTQCRTLDSLIGWLISVADEMLVDVLDAVDAEEGNRGTKSSLRTAYERRELRDSYYWMNYWEPPPEPQNDEEA